MRIQIDVRLEYGIQAPTDMLLQIRVPSLADQIVVHERYDLGTPSQLASVAAEAGMGERSLLRMESDFQCQYSATVDVDRPALDVSQLNAVPIHQLPSDVVRYLMPSRYCQSDELQSFVLAEFGDSFGGLRIARMREWINARFSYVSGSSNAQTTALDAFVQRKGVCRDFAHVLIALARASSVPARFVSVYAPFVTPQDFHAVAEVYLAGTWHLIDATGMADANQIARIGVGLDAAEVAFLTSFGPTVLQHQSVEVKIEQPVVAS